MKIKRQRTSAFALGSANCTGNEALDRLLAGNQRFAHQMAAHPDETANRRVSLAMGQHPFATIFTCADSRVPPELVFDQGLGDLFVIRVAGNIVDDAVLASIEYAVQHLGVALLMVLGHEKCGAVDAAVHHAGQEGHLHILTSAISPAVAASRRENGDPVDLAVRANVKLVVEQIRNSQPLLARVIANGSLKLVGARYGLQTGLVELIA